MAQDDGPRRFEKEGVDLVLVPYADAVREAAIRVMASQASVEPRGSAQAGSSAGRDAEGRPGDGHGGANRYPGVYQLQRSLIDLKEFETIPSRLERRNVIPDCL